MLNEYEEFHAYTEQLAYTSTGKRDTAYLGRFTFDMLLDLEGLARVLTIIARGMMWGSNEPDIDRTRRALLAWCSVPDSKKASPREDWQYRTDHRELHEEFPALELGTLWDNSISFSAEGQKCIADATPDGVPPEVVYALIAYYIANRPEDSDWVLSSGHKL